MVGKKAMNRRDRRAAGHQTRGGAQLGPVAMQTVAKALAEQQAGLFPQAVVTYRNALALAPDHPDLHNNLGVVLRLSGKLDEAMAAFRRAIALKPNYPEALNNLAAALQSKGRLDEAVESYRRAILLSPGFSGSHSNLGVALQSQGKLEEAAAAFRRAIALQPDAAEAHNNLGSALQSLGRLDEALASFERAIALKPNYADAHNNLGSALHGLGKPEEAIAAYRRAIALQDSPAAQNNLGLALQELGRTEDAIAAFRHVLALQPAHAEAQANLVRARKMACDWAGLEAEEETCRALVRAGATAVSPFLMLTLRATPAEQLLCARQWVAGRSMPAATLAPRAPKPKDRLRLGYLSADFRQHPVAVLAAELFERHDRDRFEVIGYSLGPDDGSAMRRRLEQGFDRFIDLMLLSHAEAAQRIRADEVDILVDLTGHTRGARLPLLAARPAPVQASFLGFPATMGAAYIDYVIADAVTVPMDEQPFFVEKIVHLPDCYLPSDSGREIAAGTPLRAACGLPETGLVFCCFNNTYKLSPAFFDIWARLLCAIPGSVLWLADAAQTVKHNLVREAAARGVAAERLVFAPRLPRLADHLARHRLADLFLDTLPYNAHTTASDALWAGLPVLTCAGECFAGRVAASLLAAAGLPELVTRSMADYEALALRLAAEPALLGALRQRLETNRATAPLFDGPRYLHHLESAYLRMWETWLAGQRPHAFAVAP
jgi:predicted O-linked N-acetylglucosamine transferase (SPINDLY family)